MVELNRASLADAGLRPAPARRFNPTVLAWIAIVVVLAVLVANPIVRLVVTSMADDRTGAFTLANYLTAYGRWRYVAALINTLVVGCLVVSICAAIALPLAWACARTDMPAKNLVRLSVLGSFIMPPYLGAVAWIILTGPNAGWLNRFWMAATGSSEGVFNIYTVWGLAFVMSMNLVFLLFTFATTAFEMVSSEMEDAANILGAGAFRTAYKITLPLILPSIIGGMIITFLQSIALFGVPAMIAIPARYPLVVTQLWEFFSAPVRIGAAAAYAIPLLAIAMLMFWIQRLVLSRRGFISVTGKGGERRVVRLGRWRWPVFGFALFVVFVIFFLPVGVLLLTAFSKAWGRGLVWDNLTLSNFTEILSNAAAQQAMATSFTVAGVSAVLAALLAIVVAYIVIRKLLPYGWLLGFLCVAPIVIPGAVLAIGMFTAYAGAPLYLYGTIVIIVLAFVTRFLPIAYANSSAAIRSIHPEMEDAARILGAGRLFVIRKVVAPLLKRNLVAVWMLIFITAAQELSTAIFLIGPNTRVLSVLLLDISEEGRLEFMAALGCVLLVVVTSVVALGFALVGRDFMKRGS